MRNRLSRLAAAALCGALTGCAGQPTVGQYAAPNTACCSSISEFTFRPVLLGQEVEFSLSPANPTYDFSGPRQHFVALRIPDGFAATTIQVRTYLSTAYLPQATAVIPEFLFLDVDYKVLTRRPTENFQTAGGFWRSAVSGRVQVPSQTRYIVVTAGDGRSGVPVVRSENGTPYRVNPAALGDFSLRMFGESQQ